MCEDLLSALDDYRDHTTNPHLEKTLARAYAEITNLNTRIEELTRWNFEDKSDYLKRIAELEAAYKAVTKTIHLPPGCGKYIITEKEIDKAWEYANGPYHCHLLHSDQAIHALKLIGIVACKECEGVGVGVSEHCTNCSGHGWVWKEVSDE